MNQVLAYLMLATCLPGAELRVEVRDEASRALLTEASVTAHLIMEPAPREVAGIPEGPRTRFEDLPGEVDIRLQGRSPGHTEGGILVRAGTCGGLVTLYLRPLGRIQGWVTDASRNPVAGAVITAGETGASWRATAPSDALGAFELDGLEPGATFRITCVTRNHPVWSREGVHPGTPPMAIRLENGAALRGQVRHGDGLPAARIMVRAVPVVADPLGEGGWGYAPLDPRETWTDARGEYVLGGLAPGLYLVSALRDPAPLAVAFPSPGPEGSLVRIAGEDRDGPRFTMEAPGSVRLDLGSSARAASRAHPPRLFFFRRQEGGAPFQGESRIAEARPEAGGDLWCVPEVAAGRYDLEVRLRGRMPTRFDGLEIRPREGTLLLVDTREGTRLQVHVLDEGGRDWLGLPLRIFRLDPRATGDLDAIPLENPSLEETLTDAQGRAQFEGLEPGIYQLHATDGEGPYACRTLDLSQGEGTREVEVVLARGEEVRLRLRNGRGAAVPCAEVTLVRRVPGFQGIRVPGVTDEAGECAFLRLVPGDYQVEVHAEEAASAGLLASADHRRDLSIPSGIRECVLSID